MKYIDGTPATPEQVMRDYQLTGTASPEPRLSIDQVSDFERALRQEGIASIEIPIKPDEFRALAAGYEVCLEECPEELAQTFFTLDDRNGSEVGHMRKEAKRKGGDGPQISDPKSFIHINGEARHVWRERFARGPKPLRDFLEMGIEIHDAIVGIAKSGPVSELESGSYANMSQYLFPGGESRAFLRLIRYDEHFTIDEDGNPILHSIDVAKPHEDLGTMTAQLYTDREGFWANPNGPFDNPEGAQRKEDLSTRRDYDSRDGQAYVFMGSRLLRCMVGVMKFARYGMAYGGCHLIRKVSELGM